MGGMGCSSSKGVMVTAESIAKQAIESHMGEIHYEHSNTVVIFSKSYCPFCMKAKNVLESLNAKYEVLELDLRDDGNAIQDVLNTLSGGRSVPRVFVKGKVTCFKQSGPPLVVNLLNSSLVEEMTWRAAADFAGSRCIVNQMIGCPVSLHESQSRLARTVSLAAIAFKFSQARLPEK
eukprot:768637-Hanusia_phi.AAC.1